MSDLTAHLTEALDRAEQALTGCGTDWATNGDHLTFGAAAGSVPVSDYIWDENLDGTAIAAHMVAWSPKRVLALIARDRVLITVHYRMTPDRPERMLDELRDGWCSACLPPDLPGASMYAPWPCESMRLAAKFWLPEEPTDD